MPEKDANVWAHKIYNALHNSKERIQLGMDELEYLDYVMNRLLL